MTAACRLQSSRQAGTIAPGGMRMRRGEGDDVRPARRGLSSVRGCVPSLVVLVATLGVGCAGREAPPPDPGRAPAPVSSRVVAPSDATASRVASDASEVAARDIAPDASDASLWRAPTPLASEPPSDVTLLGGWLDTPTLRDAHATALRAPAEGLARLEAWVPAPEDPAERVVAVRLWSLHLRLEAALAEVARASPGATDPAPPPRPEAAPGAATGAQPAPSVPEASSVAPLPPAELRGQVLALTEALIEVGAMAPLLAPELRLAAARMRSQAGLSEAALQALAPIMSGDGSDGVEPALRTRAQTLAARLHLDAGRRVEAAAVSEALPATPTDPEVAWLQLELTASPPAPAAIVDFLRRFPASERGPALLASLPSAALTVRTRVDLAEGFWEAGRAQTARMALAGLGAAPPWNTAERCRAGLLHGLALERATGRKNLAGQAAIHAHLARVAASCDGDAAAWATFVAGRNRARAVHREKTPNKQAAAAAEARTLLTRHLARWPERSTADDAATLLTELEEDPARADALRLKVLRDHPRGDMAEALAWGYVWPSIRAGDWATAQQRLAEIGATAAEVSGRHGGRLAYWQARALAERGEVDAATGRYQQLLRDHPLSWYAVLALSRLCGTDPACGARHLGAVVSGGPVVSDPDAWRRLWAERAYRRAVTWARIASFAHAPDAPFLDAVLAALGDVPPASRPVDEGWVWARSGVLQLAGAWSSAMGELRAAEGDGAWPLTLPLGAGAVGRPVSGDLWGRAYPRAFEDLVIRRATDAGLPPSWVWAIARTESNFNPRVVSWANAIGLMQIIPPTARELARGTALDPSRAGLEQPDNALALGTRFLARLLARHGHIPLASAGYNAGSGAVGRWRKAFGDLELDRFVEAIPYPEAHNYAKSVTQSMARYQWFHEGRILMLDLTQPVEPPAAPDAGSEVAPTGELEAPGEAAADGTE